MLNSRVSQNLLALINPTINLHPGYLEKLPFCENVDVVTIVSTCVDIARADWDNYETSWDFQELPLLRNEELGMKNEEGGEAGGGSSVLNSSSSFTIKSPSLAETWRNWREYSRAMTERMRELEEENNRLFIAAYGLEDELAPTVPIEQITLTCNPAYRYGVKIPEAEREARFLADTMKELISYAVGCMFGRYSLDVPGLVLADAGATLEDYRRIVEERRNEEGRRRRPSQRRPKFLNS